MSELEEFRYPFTSTLEFLGYTTQPAALPLVIAWILMLLVVARLLLSREADFRLKWLALYFGLTLFNNPAFQLLPSFSLGDFAGIGCAAIYLLRIVRGSKAHRSEVGEALIAAVALMSLHAIVVGFIYPDLNHPLQNFVDNVALTRALVTAKIVVFALSCFLLSETLRTTESVYWLLRQVASLALVGLVIYLLQAAMLLFGVLPYGLFLDAGYIGFPAFGSVSIERGHFGKFMTPLFPVFLLLTVRYRRRGLFLFFIVVTLVNFSASSLSFFAAYVLASLWSFRRRLLTIRTAVIGSSIFAVLAVFVGYTLQLWRGVVSKIFLLAFQGDQEGGRGFNLLKEYLDRFPLGTTYGGSSLRTAPGLAEINSGIFTFFTQESLLSLPLLAGFFVLLWAGWRSAVEIADTSTRQIIRIGIVVMPLIFAADILWFVPTIWLPLLLAFALPRVKDVEPRISNRSWLAEASQAVAVTQ